jgi:hypothetical protein
MSARFHWSGDDGLAAETRLKGEAETQLQLSPEPEHH